MTQFPVSRILKFGVVAAGVIAALAFAVVPLSVALFIHGRKRFADPDGDRTPADFGLSYEEVRFRAAPDILLRGWYVPARGAASGTVVLAHGLNRSRVEMLRKAVFLATNGYNALLFDLRHHGQSQGRRTSLGFFEADDVSAALQFLREEKGARCNLAVWGVSMGAVAVLIAAAKNLEVQAIIADSAFLSFENTLVHHARTFISLPRFPIVGETIFIMSRYLGFRPEDFDLRKIVQQIGTRPILFVAGGADRRIPPRVAMTLFQLSRSADKEVLVIDDAMHGAAYRTDPATYQAAVLRFLQRSFDVTDDDHCGERSAASSRDRRA